MEIDATIISLLKKLIRKESSTSGGISSSDKNYNNLNNKPRINGVEVSGDKSAEDYGLQPEDFVVNITEDGSSYKLDKTYDEILEAYNSGRTCYCNYAPYYYNMQMLLEKDSMGNFIFNMQTVSYVQDSPSSVISYSIKSDSTVTTHNYKIVGAVQTANEYQLGGVKANQATEEDTLPINIDENGFLKVAAKPKDFVVNVSGVGSTYDPFVSDTPIEKIVEAYKNGQSCYLSRSSNNLELYPLTYFEDNTDYIYLEFSKDIGLTTKTYHYSSSDGVWKYTQSDVTPSKYLYGGIKANGKTDNDTIPINFDSESGFAYAELNVLDKTEEDTSYTSEVKRDPTSKKLYVTAGGAGGGWSRVEKTAQDTTVQLEPNILYIFPEMETLTITFLDTTSEYHLFFISGATPTVFSMDGVLSDAYSIEANMKYEVSVLEGVAYIRGVSNA